MLDQAGFATYLARFRAAVRGPTPQLWGLHNYSDTNRFRTSGTLSMLRSVPGDIWVTETGGVAKFAQSYQRQHCARRLGGGPGMRASRRGQPFGASLEGGWGRI